MYNIKLFITCATYFGLFEDYNWLVNAMHICVVLGPMCVIECIIYLNYCLYIWIVLSPVCHFINLVTSKLLKIVDHMKQKMRNGINLSLIFIIIIILISVNLPQI